VAAACALSYLDFRFADRPWRDARPRLAAFYEAFAKRPSMQASELANPIRLEIRSRRARPAAYR
jgi:glutathione S-transferase